MKALDALVCAAQQGDKEAFGTLVRHYQNMAYGVAYARIDDPHLAQDVAQEAFVDAYLSLDKLREPAALILCARRLAYFLTQPFHGTEIWVGVPGQTIALEDTLKGCREILDGKYNDVPEEAFFMVGTVEMALEKAKE